MRITAEQITFIKRTISELRPDADIFLFGSRANDSARGGDIDILILCKPELTFQDKAKLETQFINRYGDQKIDFICFAPESEDPFKKLSMQNAIAL